MTTHRLRAASAALAVLALSATALTVTSAVPATAAVPQFPGYGPVDDESVSSAASKGDTVSCGNQFVVGAGMLAGPGDELRYDDLVPSEHQVDSYVTVDDTGTDLDWSVTTRALCSEQPGIGYEIVSATSTPRDSAVSHQATAACPGGYEVVGTGWAIYGGYGHVGVTKVVPTAGDTVEVTAHEDDTGWSGDWDVTAYAICVAGISGQRVQSFDTGSHSGTHGATNGCATDEVTLGGGFEVSGRPRHSRLSTLWPGNVYQGQGLLTVTVKEDDAGTPDDWQLRHHQICADA
jgi:hypothetical protein